MSELKVCPNCSSNEIMDNVCKVCGGIFCSICHSMKNCDNNSNSEACKCFDSEKEKIQLDILPIEINLENMEEITGIVAIDIQKDDAREQIEKLTSLNEGCYKVEKIFIAQGMGTKQPTNYHKFVAILVKR